MCEAKSWQEKGVILPHHYIKIKTLLTGINFLYACFWFTMCKYFFSWENTGKIGNLCHFDMWSHILTGKTRDTTTPLYNNPPLTQRHQLALSQLSFYYGEGYFSWQNIAKILQQMEILRMGVMALLHCILNV
jgi:hypothetical protein